MASAHAAQAGRLWELWCGLALRHVALGGACACGAGGISLRLEDFELDIIDYLQDGGERCEQAEVSAWFLAHPGLAQGGQPLRRLLDALGSEDVPQAVAQWALARLERTLRSFAEVHGGLS
ncbi:hypothetical protein [Delftia sp. PS-11]|uniref:hypothetical protein n=1 Tax=Delftia sp. PS-11 TaxID=2767222 RepID=UPI00245700F7|nr:hypothetical protein [Delftia sp. PS-11]KAJ8740724.1 hypothetical protein H9T68_23075 [Delftia sp. PS-11]